jgi:hypothetical protein
MILLNFAVCLFDLLPDALCNDLQEKSFAGEVYVVSDHKIGILLDELQFLFYIFHHSDTNTGSFFVYT